SCRTGRDRLSVSSRSVGDIAGESDPAPACLSDEVVVFRVDMGSSRTPAFLGTAPRRSRVPILGRSVIVQRRRTAHGCGYPDARVLTPDTLGRTPWTGQGAEGLSTQALRPRAARAAHGR